VVCGGGLDELALDAPTDVAALEGGDVRMLQVAPEDAGLPRAPRAALHVDDVAHAAHVARAVLGGDRGAARDAVVLNAAAALVVGGHARDLREGAARAAAALDSGSAARVFERAAAAAVEPQP
jgi:anthranilate phosphoribosyltransferase